MINNFPLINIYKYPKSNSELSSQMLYGEKFKIIYKKGNWLKIKTNYDNYTGYIQNKKFLTNFDPKFKISKIKSKIFIEKNQKLKKTNKFLYFGSNIEKINENKKFIEFEKNKWIKKKDLRKANHFEKNYSKIFKLFLNSKYLWGGKTADGIDCSSLIQIYFHYNKIFFPRDTKDQINYCKENNKKTLLKGDIIFWKGHVGVCLNRFKFIHAYGPRKKVLIMPTNLTIQHIKSTSQLIVKKVSNINTY
ncbi:C40 family peptidase [Candidatus Pelagibacter sp.]|nr:C40 family peptidase [Candidatus Pelagibacter sp.]